MIRVVQIEPGPIPTLIASAPASTSARAASAVATLPATTWTELDACFTRSTARATSVLWPCAVSMTMQSHPRLHQRLGPGKTRVANGRRGRNPQPPSPNSLVAKGAATDFSMSLTVMSPTQWMSLSTTSSFSMRR